MKRLLTFRQYGFVKRLEHFWKGLRDNRSQISPVPPQQYGDRFLNFVTGITMTKEEAERRKRETGENPLSEVAPIGLAASQRTSLNNPLPPSKPNSMSLDVDRTNEKLAGRSPPGSPMAVEQTMAKAQKQVDRETSEKGRRRSEEEKPSRTLLTTEDQKSNTLLPAVSEENGENGSRSGSATASRTVSRNQDLEPPQQPQSPPPPPPPKVDKVRRSEPSPRKDPPRRRESEGIRMVDQHETDFFGNEKVSVTMPAPGQGVFRGEEDDDLPPHRLPNGISSPTTTATEDGEVDSERGEKRRSKPPRINSDIIPPFSPFETSSPMAFAESRDPEKQQQKEALR